MILHVRSFFSGVTALSVVALGYAGVLTGCAKKAPAPPRQPEAIEQVVFKGVSSFYCAKHRWPSSWDELVGFEGLSVEARNGVAEMISPELSSPRAVILVVRYRNSQGIDRKVTYIAPPECKRSSDPALVSIAGGRVSFMLPKGFVALDGPAIRAKWKGGPYPDAAWFHEVKGAYITVSFGEVQITDDQLEDLKGELEATYEASLPGLVWVERTYAADEEPPKLVHMLSSDAPQGRLLSYAMSMSFDQRLFTLSIAGPESKIDAIENVANSVRSTLRVR